MQATIPSAIGSLSGYWTASAKSASPNPADISTCFFSWVVASLNGLQSWPQSEHTAALPYFLTHGVQSGAPQLRQMYFAGLTGWLMHIPAGVGAYCGAAAYGSAPGA